MKRFAFDSSGTNTDDKESSERKMLNIFHFHNIYYNFKYLILIFYYNIMFHICCIIKLL